MANPARSCRMLGAIALPDASLSALGNDGNHHPYLLAELEEFRLQGGSGQWPYSNQDGWGMSGYHQFESFVEIQTVRSELEAYEDEDYYFHTSNLLAPDQVNVLMGHLRQTSSGADGIENPHPFIYTTPSGDTYSFGHNGDLNKSDLRDLIGDEWLALHPPQTYGGGAWDGAGWSDVVDSELYFLWLVKNIEELQSVPDGILYALTILEAQQPYMAKNFLFSDGQDLYGYRRAITSDIYYYDALDVDNIPAHLSPGNHRTIMSTPPPEGPVSELPWVELPDRTLLIFKANGDTELHTVNPTSVTNAEMHIPGQSNLAHIYPNPFNGNTHISVALEHGGEYSIHILNSRGQEIFSQMHHVGSKGHYEFAWRGQDDRGQALDSGCYFFLLRQDSKTIATGKLLLLK